MKDWPEPCGDLTEEAAPPWWMVLVVACLAMIACGVLALAAVLVWLVTALLG